MQVTIEDAREAAEAILRGISPVSICVFGNVAREGSGNELDLLIVVDEEPQQETQVLLHGYLKPFYRRFDIDPFVISPDKLMKHFKEGTEFFIHLFINGNG